MLDTSARLLALLSLLQSRPAWSGPQLSDRLEVSTRTIRNDIERLRSLGYPVDAERGPTGHYRLGAGAKLPPLLLDDEEAVGLAVALRVAAGVAGIEETAARTLAKLEQVLPHRLHRKVSAIQAAVSRGPDNTGSNVEDPDVDPATLGTIAAAIRDTELLRFDYQEQRIVLEPYRLVSWARRWYLVARDPRTGGWSIHRVDWMTLGARDGRPFAPHPLGEGDYTDLVLRTVASTGWAVHARIGVRAAAGEVLARINSTVGVVEPVDDDNCVLVTGADSLETIAVYIGMLGLDFRIESPPELIYHVRDLGERYSRAVEASSSEG